MFAPKVAKAQTKAVESRTSELVPQRSTPAARTIGGGAVEQAHIRQQNIGNQAALRLLSQRAWSPTAKEVGNGYQQETAPENMVTRDVPRGVAGDFSNIPVFAPDREARPQAPSSFTGPVSPATLANNVLSMSGHALDPSIRAFIEPRFNHDFSQVQVHTNDDAARSAHAVGAKAYTVGAHIVFGEDRYQPATPTGMKLLAHELAHVAQQHASTAQPVAGTTADAHEWHADAVADTIARGDVAAALLRQAPRSPPVLQRAPEDQADSPEQLRLPPKGVNPEVDLPRSPMETAKVAWATGHQVITFILGPDSDKFYRAAHEYWRQAGRTNVLVTDQRTLTDVLGYLNSNPSPNGNSWGQINLVTHANEEGGMGIKLSAQSQTNISPEELDKQIQAGAIPKVDDSAVDFHTNINVHGCAIGRSPQMLQELSQAIGGGQANVYGPKDLQAYKFSGTGQSEKTEEFLVEYWSVGFPASQARSRKQLVQDLNEKYGAGPGVDWGRAIAGAKTMTMPYHHEFTAGSFTNVPAKGDHAGHVRLLQQVPASAGWTRWSVKDESVAVDDSGNETTTIQYNFQTRDDAGKLVSDTTEITITNPIPSTVQARGDWLKSQIGADKAAQFSWNFALHGLPASGRSAKVTLVCEGKRTVVRIERDLKDPTGAYLHPSREDPAHYGAYKP